MALAGGPAGVRNRLQYLSISNFPPGLRVGKARRADYGLDEVWALCLATALMRAGMPPAASAAIVTDYWPEIARGLVEVGGRSVRWQRPLAAADHVFMIVGAERLPDSIRGDDPRGPARSYSIYLGPLSSERVVTEVGAGGAVVVDLDRILADMNSALAADPASVSEGTVREALDELEQLHGTTSEVELPEVRRIAGDNHAEQLVRGQRLREMDYYFTRAEEIASAAVTRVLDQSVPNARQAVLLRYLARPAPREIWKRRVRVVEEVGFDEALDVLTCRLFRADSIFPATMGVAAAHALAKAGLADTAALATALIRIASEGRKWEPASAVAPSESVATGERTSS